MAHTGVNDDRVENLKKAVDSVYEQNNNFASKIIGPAHQGDITNNYNREPDRAVCDSVGYIRIPSVFISLDCSRAFNIISTPRSAPRSDTTASGNIMHLHNVQITRNYDLDNPADVFAFAQNPVAGIQALLNEQHTRPDGVEPQQMHNLICAVQTGGADTSIDEQSGSTLDMRKGLLAELMDRWPV